MSYIVFARKYRPQTFDDIVGQPHITTTLKNAISQDRVAHAYLFAGPRGVGKTTTARILAKALNCEKGPITKPCNACPSCKEITQGTSLDILEIDGASNRGIDEIRNLRENVKFAPSKGRLKIYIIDEVHMLTPEAFNALLKTLEEPPAHVKFIFATTQAHKVPQTILSRCQRFDFRRIPSKDILENLKKISKNENLKIEESALALIARYSDGGMRDAQVTLDQVTSFVKDKIEAADVSQLLGVVDDEILFGLSGAISGKDPVIALKIIDTLINEGKDVSQVVFGLIEHFRNISITKISKDLDSLIDAGEEKIKEYKAESQKFTIEEILYIIYTLSNTIDFMRKSNIARIPLEAAMVKLTRTGSSLPLDEVMKKLDIMAQTGKRVESQKPEQKTETRTVRTEEAAPAAKKIVAQTAAPAGFGELLSSWQNVINYIMPKKISIASYLQEGYPVSLESNTLTIGFPKALQFHKEVLESIDNKRLIEEAIKGSLGLDLRVMFTITESVNGVRRGSASGLGSEDDIEELPGHEMETKEVDPIVKAALDVFGGDITGRDANRRRAR